MIVRHYVYGKIRSFLCGKCCAERYLFARLGTVRHVFKNLIRVDRVFRSVKVIFRHDHGMDRIRQVYSARVFVKYDEVFTVERILDSPSRRHVRSPYHDVVFSAVEH